MEHLPENDGFDMPALLSLARDLGLPMRTGGGDVPVVVGKRNREVTKQTKGNYDLWNHMGRTPHMKEWDVSRERAIEFLNGK